MREYKFRAWLKISKKMIPYEKIEYIDFLDDQINIRYTWDEDEALEDTMNYSFAEVELMQYTGLKDKNGKEIYEGDILHISEGLRPQYVRWVEWMAGFAMALRKTSGTTGIPEECEVIGNIYENPELAVIES